MEDRYFWPQSLISLVLKILLLWQDVPFHFLPHIEFLVERCDTDRLKLIILTHFISPSLCKFRSQCIAYNDAIIIVLKSIHIKSVHEVSVQIISYSRPGSTVNQW